MPEDKIIEFVNEVLSSRGFTMQDFYLDEVEEKELRELIKSEKEEGVNLKRIPMSQLENSSYSALMDQLLRKLFNDLNKKNIEHGKCIEITRFLSTLGTELDFRIIKNVRL
jgi:aspartate/glutamate racemase